MKTATGNNDIKSSSIWLLIIGVAFNTIYFKIDFEDPFNTPKLIILMILSSWITGHLINSYRAQGLILKSRDFKVLLLSFIFIITLFISTLLTDVPLVGFIGDTQRRNGFLAYLGLTIIMIYASRVINFKYISRIFKVAIITGLILSGYGLIQSSGNDFVKWNNPHNSMIATLGNPNFASAMLAILALLSIFSLLVKIISPIYKIIGVAVIIMSLTAIIDSQSRQGLVTLFFGITFFISIFIYFNNKKMALIVTPAAVITAIFVVLGMLQKGPLTYLLYKDSVSTRGYYWRAGIEMLKSEPFTGVGVDRYGAYFKQFREVAYPLKYGFEINSSNAHNTIIQIFSTAGLFVGVSYLFILGYIFFSGLKLVKNTKADQQKIALALLATWIGFQAQSIISIDMIGISVWGWLLGGSILGLSRSVEDDSTKDLNNNSTLKNKISATRINLFQPIVSSLVLVPALILSTYLYRSESNTYIDRSFTNPDIQQNKQVVYEYANRVINNPMSDPYYRFQVSINLYTMGFKDEAYVEILKLVKYDDKNLDYLYTLSLMEKDRLNIPNAIFAKEQIAKYDPWNAENYFQLYMLYKEVGDTLKAEKIKNKVLDFAPDSLQAKSIRESLA